MELNMTEEAGEEDRLIARLIEEAIKNIFDQHFSPKQFRNVVEYFENGNTLEVSDRMPVKDYLSRIDKIRNFSKQVEKYARELEPEMAAGSQADAVHVSVAEFILDALHCHNRLNKKQKSGTALYEL